MRRAILLTLLALVLVAAAPSQAGTKPSFIKTYDQWVYHFSWRQWLPAKWQRIAMCETHLNWRHANSSFQGAFGFATSSWDSFVPRADPKAGPYPSEAYLATPRQQYEVALAIYRRYGLSGWGCRAA